MEKQNMDDIISITTLNEGSAFPNDIEMTKKELMFLLKRDIHGAFHNVTHIVSYLEAYKLIIEGEKIRWLPEMDSEYSILQRAKE